MNDLPDFGEQVIARSHEGWRVAHRRQMRQLVEKGWQPLARHCSHCGAENGVRWHQQSGYDPESGERRGYWETVCPNRSRWRIWHHSGGVLAPPPPAWPPKPSVGPVG